MPSSTTKLGDKLLAGILGGAVMMTDGYAPYNDIARRHQLVYFGCCIHVRRYFLKAEDSVPKEAPIARFVGDALRQADLQAIRSEGA